MHLANSTLGADYTYDNNGHDRRLLGIANGAASRSLNYVTTPENFISQIKETALGQTKAWAYGYDDADRLLTAQSGDGSKFRYSYDPAHNLTSIVNPQATTNYTPNNLNQIAAANLLAYQYDANGNLIDDGARTYQWDADNRLLQINYKAQPNRNTKFRYDGIGRRVAIISKSGTVSTESRYLWCGEDLCQGRNANDDVIRRYYDEGEIRQPGNTLLYYSRDHLGSVRDVLTVQNGVRVASFDYDPYGKPTHTSGRLSTDFRYAGMFYLQESGLYLTQYRVYDPNMGRWLSRDPIDERSSINLYAYANGDPIDHNDPTGEFVPLIVALPIIGGIAGGVADVMAAGPCTPWYSAFSRGFVSGATGTLAGMGVAAATGNPWLAGGAAGAVSQGLDQAISGDVNVGSAVVGVVGGVFGGGVMAKLLPTVGRLPSLLLPRTLQNFGPNSARMAGQETGSNAIGAVAGIAIPSSGSSECKCH